MLPTNYQVGRQSSRHDDSDDSDDDQERSRPLPPTKQQAPPLGVTGVLCDTQVLQDNSNNRGTLQYTVFRPRYVKLKPPLVCVAGGPYLVSRVVVVVDWTVGGRLIVWIDFILHTTHLSLPVYLLTAMAISFHLGTSRQRPFPYIFRSDWLWTIQTNGRTRSKVFSSGYHYDQSRRKVVEEPGPRYGTRLGASCQTFESKTLSFIRALVWRHCRLRIIGLG